MTRLFYGDECCTNPAAFLSNEFVKPYVVHKFCCLRCKAEYNGKTERNLFTRLKKQACSDKESLTTVFNHLFNWRNYKHIKSIVRFKNGFFNSSEFDLHSVLQLTEVVDSATNRNILLIKETLHIKQNKKDSFE